MAKQLSLQVCIIIMMILFLMFASLSLVDMECSAMARGGLFCVFLLAMAAPILMSGMIEILQEYCTSGRRNGDWYDFLANTLGVLLAAVVGFVYAKGKGKL